MRLSRLAALLLVTVCGTARADYIYTVHYDELSIDFFGTPRTYSAQEFSFVTPTLIGVAPDYTSQVVLPDPKPVFDGFPIDKTITFAFGSGQYVFSAPRPAGTIFATGDVRSLIWAFATPSGTEEYGIGTYGLNCLRNGEPTDLCFARNLENLPAGTGAGTGYMTVAVVPIPAAAWLLASALGGLGAARRWRIRRPGTVA